MTAASMLCCWCEWREAERIDHEPNATSGEVVSDQPTFCYCARMSELKACVLEVTTTVALQRSVLRSMLPIYEASKVEGGDRKREADTQRGGRGERQEARLSESMDKGIYLMELRQWPGLLLGKRRSGMQTVKSISSSTGDEH